MATRVILTAEQKAMVREEADRALRRYPLYPVHPVLDNRNPIDALCNEHGCQMRMMDSRNQKLESNNQMLQNRNDILEEALQSIASWVEAYPLDILPEPDFGKAAELLKAGDITLDSVAASCMRRVVQGVGTIAKEALEAKP